jgi:hypothetical protein
MEKNGVFTPVHDMRMAVLSEYKLFFNHSAQKSNFVFEV